MSATPGTLDAWLREAGAAAPSKTAVEELSGRALTYADLDRRSEGLAARLRAWGAGPGERVAFCLPKSLESVVAIHAILKSGAAYVPLDPLAPPDRALYILRDCGARVLVTDASRARAWAPAIEGAAPRLIHLGPLEGGAWNGETADFETACAAPGRVDPSPPDPKRLAYLLYTSGSTGRPKGVMLTHENAVSFLRWCLEALPFRPDDRFSSHAPFHFDLSVLDLFVPALLGATVVLISEEVGKDPKRLAPAIAAARLTVWYSTPSVLALLAQFGILGAHDFSSLRVVLFAGEVFPLQHFRAVKRAWPRPAYFNLYGPTETNVCTYFAVPDEVPEERTDPFPIGVPCSHCSDLVVDERLQPVGDGELGELCIRGPSVFAGYLNLPEKSGSAFLPDGGEAAWYRTGDLVRRAPDGNLVYHGRRDRMVKRRGYRIELAEVEAALQRHPGVLEAALVATPDAEGGVSLVAFVAPRPGVRLSVIEMKRHGASLLPVTMSPDRFVFVDRLPKTSTDKVDYPRLKELAGAPPATP